MNALVSRSHAAAAAAYSKVECTLALYRISLKFRGACFKFILIKLSKWPAFIASLSVFVPGQIGRECKAQVLNIIRKYNVSRLQKVHSLNILSFPAEFNAVTF